MVVKTALSQKQIERRSPLFFQRRAIAVELLFLINFQRPRVVDHFLAINIHILYIVFSTTF